jgi:hypothetical protein
MVEAPFRVLSRRDMNSSHRSSSFSPKFRELFVICDEKLEGNTYVLFCVFFEVILINIGEQLLHAINVIDLCWSEHFLPFGAHAMLTERA